MMILVSTSMFLRAISCNMVYCNFLHGQEFETTEVFQKMYIIHRDFCTKVSVSSVLIRGSIVINVLQES